MRLGWMGEAGSRLVTEALSRWGITTERHGPWAATLVGPKPVRKVRPKPSPTRAPDVRSSLPDDVVIVTLRAPEAWEPFSAIAPASLRERLASSAIASPGIVVDMSSGPRQIARALSPLRDVLERTTTVAIVTSPEGAAEAARLGLTATVHRQCERLESARFAARLCRAMAGETTPDRTLEERHRQLQEAHARLLARTVDTDARHAVIVHDLRSPLGVVRGVISELLEGAFLSPEDHKLVELMDHASVQLERLLERLDQLSTWPKEPPRIERIDLAALARGVTDGLRRSPDARGKALDVQATSPEHVRGDRHDFVRVLSSLLSNALRHTRSTVQVRVEADGGEVRLEVLDDGPGIPPPIRAQLFQRTSHQPGARRLGLGLADVHRTVERHGGRIAVYDRREHEGLEQPGTRFVVHLPRACGR